MAFAPALALMSGELALTKGKSRRTRAVEAETADETAPDVKAVRPGLAVARFLDARAALVEARKALRAAEAVLEASVEDPDAGAEVKVRGRGTYVVTRTTTKARVFVPTKILKFCNDYEVDAASLRGADNRLSDRRIEAACKRCKVDPETLKGPKMLTAMSVSKSAE